ncbi:multidrug ABC transporter permease/ATP-binding protein [Neisseriaceae bacterium B1]
MDIIKLIYTHHKTAFLQMLTLTLVSGALGIGTLSYINNHLLRNNDLNSGGIGQFILLVIFYFLAASFAQIQLARIGQNFIRDTQMQLVKRIMDSHQAQIQLIGKPKILASLGSDIRSLSIAFTRLPELVQGVLFVAACSLYLIWLSPKLFLVTAVLMLLMIGGTHFVVKRHYSSFRAMRSAEDEIQRHYETALDGHKELTLNRYRAERFYNEEFTPQAHTRRNAHVKADSYHAIAVNWGNSIMLAAVGIIFYLATHHGWTSLSDAATISMTVLFMRGPLTSAIGAFPAIMQSQVGLQALKDLGLDDYRPEFHGTHKLPENWQTIRLENITYSYPVQGGQHFALQPINLTLQRGETVFLIGGNGSGKSTLSMVLSGLYTPSSGKIFVDDVEITDENRHAYRQLFASVFTDFHLFEQLMDGTGQDIGDADIQNWLQHLQLHEKVKIDTGRILNSQLSQGQRKRLGLLIAALENRSIMVLDEWAADQDPQFRRVFYEQLLPLLKQQGYTLFAISHDDKYFHHAERIISMKQGELSEFDAVQAKIVADEHSRGE